MEYTIDYCKNNKVAICCGSIYQSYDVLSKLKALGVQFWDGNEILDASETYWSEYNNCYRLTEEGKIACGNLDFYESEGYAIINAVTFIQDNTPRLYTEAEVLEFGKKCFTEGYAVDAYDTFEDYIKHNPLQKDLKP